MNLDLVIKFLGKIFVFLLLQIFIFNNIHISSLGISPMIYIAIILAMPFETPGWLMIISAFAIGITVDISQDTGGAHAAASVLIIFLRPKLLELISPREGYENGTKPASVYFGTSWFLKYAGILIFIHHFTFIYIEAFSFDGFFLNFLKVTLTFVFTTFIVYLTQLLIFKK